MFAWSIIFFLIQPSSWFTPGGIFLFDLGVAVAAGSCSANASCCSTGCLVLSSFTAQPARRAGKCHTPDTGQVFGLAPFFNIWITSCEVVSTSKREFRLKGGEIPFESSSGLLFEMFTLLA